MAKSKNKVVKKDVFASTQIEEVKLVELNSEVAIYEKGWWMKRKHYDFMLTRSDLGFDKNERTREITYFLLPPNRVDN